MIDREFLKAAEANVADLENQASAAFGESDRDGAKQDISDAINWLLSAQYRRPKIATEIENLVSRLRGSYKRTE